MKIIHCLIQYFPRHIAGTEVYTHTLAGLQQLKGHEVAVVTPHIESYMPGEMNSHYQYQGIDVYQFMETADPKNRDIYSGKKKPEGLGNFLTLLKQLKPDVIHFHELNRSIGFTIEHVKIAKQFGAKVFITMHLSFYTCYTNTLISNHKLCKGKTDAFSCSACVYNSFYKLPFTLAKPISLLSVALENTHFTGLMAPGKLTTFISIPSFINRIKRELAELAATADRIVSLTDWYRNILLLNKVPEEKIAVIKQAIASVASAPVFKQHRITQRPIRMVFLGRIQAQKGVHLIIEAMKSLSEKDITVHIYGKEEDSDYYKKCNADSAGNANISWKGLIARENVVEILSAYDLLCLPSVFSEMSPLVIQEAFAAGIPVIASRVYGNAEQIIPQKNGLLFDFNDASSLAAQLALLINNPALLDEMKSNIKLPGSFEVVCESYLNLYQACN